MSQTRDVIGQFAPAAHSDPELHLSPTPADVEGLRATLVDFLEGSLPGFGVNVDGVERYVDLLVDSLVAAHIDD